MLKLSLQKRAQTYMIFYRKDHINSTKLSRYQQLAFLQLIAIFKVCFKMRELFEAIRINS